jgi:hypothetical protein
MIKVIDNFLDQKDYNNISSIIKHHDFPWRIREKNTPDIPEESPYFTHCFFNDMEPKSFAFPDMAPFIKKLNTKAIVQLRANLTLVKTFKKCGWHTDYDFDCKTAILYFSNIGATEVGDQLVESKENRVLIFNSQTKHRVIGSEKGVVRIVLNINYYD